MLHETMVLILLSAIFTGGVRRWRPALGWPLQASVAFICAVALMSVGDAVLRMLWAVKEFDGYFANGAFQMLNALRRIDAGQRIGVDLQYFHGPLMPYLHLPIYRLAPGLAGVEASRFGVSLLCFLGAYLLVFRVAAGRWGRALLLTAAAVAVGEVLRVGSVVGPTNSSTGVRAFLPLVFIALRLWPGLGAAARSLASALLLALAMLASTEHGLAIFLAYALASFAWQAFAWEGREGWGWLGATLGLCLLLFAAFGSLLAGSPSAFGQALRFNYGQVPLDQFWYFGVPPNPWVERLSDLSRPHFIIPFGLHVLTTAGALWLWRSSRGRQLKGLGLGMVGAMALLYGYAGMVGYLGMAVRAYMEPLMRLDFLIVGAVAGYLWREQDPGLDRVMARAAVGLAVGLALLWPHAFLFYNPHKLGLPPLGRPSGLSGDWAAYDAEVQSRFKAEESRLGRPLQLWSTYSTLLEERTGRFHPHTDYIIHALGPEARASYLAAFLARKPDVVQTLRSRVFVYEEWLRGSSWGFYEAVLKDYDPWFIKDHSVFWRRRAVSRTLRGAPVELLSAPLASPATVDLAKLPRSRFVVLEARYSLANPWLKLPVFGKLPRYFIETQGAQSAQPVSLPPYGKAWSFPLVRREDGGALAMSIAARGLLPGAELMLEGLTAWPLADDAATRAMLLDVDPAHAGEAPYEAWTRRD